MTNTGPEGEKPDSGSEPTDAELFDTYQRTRNSYPDDDSEEPHHRYENPEALAANVDWVTNMIPDADPEAVAEILGLIHGMNSGDNARRIFDGTLPPEGLSPQ